jgi:hypothetical protein
VTQLLEEPEYLNNVSMDTWLRDEPTADRIKVLGDLKDDKLDVHFDRIYEKLDEFRKAVGEEALIHSGQATIEHRANEPLRFVLECIERGVRP